MKRMLFNATQAEELRVAIVDGQKLIDLDIESAAKEQRKSNIYKAVITRIEPSLEAAFVDYGTERHGFLPFKEVSRSYFQAGIEVGRARIQDALKVGQELIVQVEKDERGNKGAALTTYISLAGRYLVLMPNNPRGGGVSRRIEGEERQELREVMDRLDIPPGMSLIARTAGIGRSAEELQWDLNYLLQLWNAIDGAAKAQSGAFLIYQESSLVIRAIRDYFQPEIGEILIDTDDIFEQAQQFMSHVMPGNVARVKRYHDDVPLFSRFQIEHQIESAYSRQVNLPSGGAVVIDHTEALVAVDVNSGRATKGADIEETALRTNLEAADEIARQLRLRDLGGLIVIDFIDMESSKSQRDVENRLRDALHFDRARVQTGKISRFGLLELSRQRLRPALAETSYITCPRCTGTGHIRSTESAALHILRILEEEAMKENTGAIHVQVPVDVATFLLNEKRVDIARIELRHHANMLIIPNRHLETPQHEIIRLRHDQLNLEGRTLASYEMATKPAEENPADQPGPGEVKAVRQEAAVKGITPDQPAPMARPVEATPPPPKPGLFARIMAWFTRDNSAAEEPVAPPPQKSDKPRRERSERGDRTNRGRRENRDSRDTPRDNRESRDTRDSRESKESKEKNENATSLERKDGRNRGERKDGRQSTRRDTRATADDENLSQTAAASLPPPETASNSVATSVVDSVVSPVQQPAQDTPGAEANARDNDNRRRGRRGGRGRNDRRNEESTAPTIPATPVATALEPTDMAESSPEPSTRPADQANLSSGADMIASSPPDATAPAISGATVDAASMPAAVPPAPTIHAQVAEVASVAAGATPFQPTSPAIAVISPAPSIPVADTDACNTILPQPWPTPVALSPTTASLDETPLPAATAPASECPIPAIPAPVVTEAAVAGITVTESTAVGEVAGSITAPDVTAPDAPVNLSATLQQAGLEMIETAPPSAKPLSNGAATKPLLGRKPKVVQTSLTDEPLQMVETRHNGAVSVNR